MIRRTALQSLLRRSAVLSSSVWPVFGWVTGGSLLPTGVPSCAFQPDKEAVLHKEPTSTRDVASIIAQAELALRSRNCHLHFGIPEYRAAHLRRLPRRVLRKRLLGDLMWPYRKVEEGLVSHHLEPTEHLSGCICFPGMRLDCSGSDKRVSRRKSTVGYLTKLNRFLVNLRETVIVGQDNYYIVNNLQVVLGLP